MRTAREWLAAIALFGVMTAGYADGPGAYRPRPSRQPVLSPSSGQGATDAYTAGYASILRAEHAENLAAASADATERKTAQRDAQDAYRASLEKFTTAVRLDGSMHEAYTYLGYANRKLGRYSEALEAYEQALRIEPDTPHAIQYQGEAFLGLNRVDEARFNFLRLYALDQRQAGKLLLAIRNWVEANSAKPPAGIDMPALAAWVTEKAAAMKIEGSGSW
jgi:tetratricopeptide (TPR) repeat protein